MFQCKLKCKTIMAHQPFGNPACFTCSDLILSQNLLVFIFILYLAVIGEVLRFREKFFIPFYGKRQCPLRQLPNAFSGFQEYLLRPIAICTPRCWASFYSSFQFECRTVSFFTSNQDSVFVVKYLSIILLWPKSTARLQEELQNCLGKIFYSYQ